MSYIGDFALGVTFDTKFTTVSTVGAPTTLAGTPVISAYVDNNTTEITAGITLTVDFDSRTGMHNVRVVATSGNGYASGGNYQLVITTGTVGGTSVVGYVVAEFSIEARSSLRPTTSGRTLDVSSGGEAGVDWANVGSQSTSVNLSATTVNLTNTATAVTNQVTANVTAISGDTTAADNAESFFDGTGYAGTGNTIPTVTTVNGLAANTVTASALAADAVTEIQSGLATPTNITAGTITTVTNLTNAPTAGDFTATMKTSLNAATPSVTVSDKTGFSLSAAGIQAIWNALTAALTTAGSIGKLLVDNINATISSRSSHSAADVWAVATRLLTAGTNIVLAKGVGVTGFNDLDAAGVRAAVGLASANLDTQLSAIDDLLDTEVSAIKTKTDQLTFTVANQVDSTSVSVSDKTGYRLSAAGVDDISDEVYEGALTLRQMIRVMFSALAGKASGLPLAPKFRDVADSKNRIDATTDANGNRSAITLDGS